jgi:hypothetical protein
MMRQNLIAYLKQYWPLRARWKKHDRFAPKIVATPLLRDLLTVTIKSQGRGGVGERLPPTRPAEMRFGRRERAHNHGRE